MFARFRRSFTDISTARSPPDAAGPAASTPCLPSVTTFSRGKDYSSMPPSEAPTPSASSARISFAPRPKPHAFASRSTLLTTSRLPPLPSSTFGAPRRTLRRCTELPASCALHRPCYSYSTREPIPAGLHERILPAARTTSAQEVRPPLRPSRARSRLLEWSSSDSPPSPRCALAVFVPNLSRRTAPSRHVPRDRSPPAPRPRAGSQRPDLKASPKAGEFVGVPAQTARRRDD